MIKQCKNYRHILTVLLLAPFIGCSANDRSEVKSKSDQEKQSYEMTAESIKSGFKSINRNYSMPPQRAGAPSVEEEKNICPAGMVSELTTIASSVYNKNKDLIKVLIELKKKANQKEIDKIIEVAKKMKPLTIKLLTSASELLIKSCLPEDSFIRAVAEVFIERLPDLMDMTFDLITNMSLNISDEQLTLIIDLADIAIEAIESNADLIEMGLIEITEQQ